jgi:ATP-dependent protease Clp ATPase subunit
MIPELVGRLPVITPLDAADDGDALVADADRAEERPR